MWTGTTQAQEKGTRSGFFLRLCLRRPGSHMAYACARVVRVNQPEETTKRGNLVERGSTYNMENTGPRGRAISTPPPHCWRRFQTISFKWSPFNNDLGKTRNLRPLTLYRVFGVSAFAGHFVVVRVRTTMRWLFLRKDHAIFLDKWYILLGFIRFNKVDVLVSRCPSAKTLKT